MGVTENEDKQFCLMEKKSIKIKGQRSLIKSQINEFKNSAAAPFIHCIILQIHNTRCSKNIFELHYAYKYHFIVLFECN